MLGISTQCHPNITSHQLSVKEKKTVFAAARSGQSHRRNGDETQKFTANA
jgi:hypothetical protein